MQLLPDGTYDVVLVAAEVDEHGDLHVEVTITLGPHVGQVVPLRNFSVADRGDALGSGDPYVLLGIPGTLRVRGGVPTFRPEAV
jgi:hypothetical protein